MLVVVSQISNIARLLNSQVLRIAEIELAARNAVPRPEPMQDLVAGVSEQSPVGKQLGL